MNHIRHVAIIMDGNGRWGIKHKKSRKFGHQKGIEAVEKIIQTYTDNFVKKVDEKVTIKEKEIMTI